MKKWWERIADHCVTVMCSPVAWLLAAVYLVVLFSFISGDVKDLILWKHMVTQPEPEHCALCTDYPWITGNYPCLVKLSTGEVREIRVYEEDLCPFSLKNSFATVVTGAKPGVTTVTLPKKPLYINPTLYCHDCRAKLGAVIEGSRIYLDGYVLMDRYDLENIRTYAVKAGAAYDIRGYTVEVTKENGQLTVEVTGYFE